MYSYYSITANNVDTTPQERDEIWEEYHFRLYFFRYTIGLTQAVSCVFMFWAILKIYFATGHSLTLSELADQKMIGLHFLAMVIYLAAVVTNYIFVALWTETDKNQENRVFVSWAICQLLLTVVQLVLIYIFWGLSKKEEVVEFDDVPDFKTEDSKQLIKNRWTIDATKQHKSSYLSANNVVTQGSINDDSVEVPLYLYTNGDDLVTTSPTNESESPFLRLQNRESCNDETVEEESVIIADN